MLYFCFLFGTLTSLLEDDLLVTLWTDILAFSLHVKLLSCVTMCEKLSHSLFFDCVIYASWILSQWTWLYSFLCFSNTHACWDMIKAILFCDPIARWAYLELFLLIWAYIPFHCSTTHYKPLAWKTMIIPTLGNFGALELFWEWVLNWVWSSTTSVVVHALVICSWDCSFVYPGGISKLLFLYMFFV